MRISTRIFSTVALLALLPSCLVQQAVDIFVRKDYPGPRPAMVIRDNNGQPASSKRLTVNSTDLPAPASLIGKQTLAPDGIPYGFTSSFTYIVYSPYAPYSPLDYKGFSGGDKVWDPYTGKAFYIPRIHTFN